MSWMRANQKAGFLHRFFPTEFLFYPFLVKKFQIRIIWGNNPFRVKQGQGQFLEFLSSVVGRSAVPSRPRVPIQSNLFF